MTHDTYCDGYAYAHLATVTMTRHDYGNVTWQAACDRCEWTGDRVGSAKDSRGHANRQAAIHTSEKACAGECMAVKGLAR